MSKIFNKKLKYKGLDSHKYGVHSIVYKLIENNKSILDIGCATGYLAEKLNEKKCVTWGIDIDKEALKIAKQSCEKVFLADASDLSNLKINKKFDYILILDVIEHLINPEVCLKQVQRFLKREGKIIISTPNIAHLSIRLNLLFGKFNYEDMGILDRTHIKFFTKSSFTDSLMRVDLHIEKMEYSVDFGQIPLFGRFLDIINPELQKIITTIFNSLLTVQLIAVCRVNKEKQNFTKGSFKK